MTIDRRDFLKRSIFAGAAFEFGDWSNILEVSAHPGPLSQKLSEQEQVVQLLAGGERSLRIAHELLSSGTAPVRLHEAACYVVGEHGSWSDAAILFRAFAHPSDQVRHPAIEALQKIIGPYNKNVPLLVRDREDLLPPELLPSDAARWVSAVRPLLKDESDLVRAAAAETLGLLRARRCLADLRELASADSMEPVRYFASRAVEILTGEAVDFVSIDEIRQSRVPLVSVPKGGRENAGQLGPLFRAAWSNPQAKFTIPEWIPARRQTIAHLWWDDEYFCVDLSCDDPDAGGNKGDEVTLLLQAGDESQIHSFECPAEGGRVTWMLIREHRRHVVHSATEVQLTTNRDKRAWYASLKIPFRALARVKPLNEQWRANLIRVESHGGGRPEVSSWAYYHRDSRTPPSLGTLRFTERSAQIDLRPEPHNIFIYPIDDYSPASDRDRVVEPESETIWGNLIPPEQLVPGANRFSVSPTYTDGDETLVVSALDGRAVVASESRRLDAARIKATTTLRLPETVKARALDVEIEVRANAEVLSRTFLPSLPIVSPPKKVLHYPLKLVAGTRDEWQAKKVERHRLTIRDHGPMLLTESYPMVLVHGANGVLYGGTYPGGRLFSYDPEAGRVADLGSPSPPHNHLHDLVATPDGLIFGGLYRPEGRLFVFDTKTKVTTDLGVPVPGGSSATCKVQTWAKGKVYGCQRGHLFYSGPDVDSVVNKGSFLFKNKRYPPSVIVADSDGNLLGVAGGSLFRYVAENDEVMLSDLSFKAEGSASVLGGWLLKGPDGKVYALANDGRLFRWEPEHDQLVLAARYAAIPPGPGVSVVITETQELVVGRSGIINEDENVLLVYGPGRTEPLNLGNPIPGHLYLTALTLGKANVVYGVSTRRAYSLRRTPIHVYSLSQI